MVDEDVNVQNLIEVQKAVLKNVISSENLVFSDGPLDALDHSSNNAMFGSRLGVDATTNINNEEQDIKNNSYKIIIISKDKPWQGRETLEEFMKANNDKFVIVVDDVDNTNDLSTIMWKLFNNIDAKRDIIIIDDKIGIDATKKMKSEGLTRDWPNDIEMSEEIKQYVNERWNEYGID